ncbi:hypothetical protein F5Y15DRAFT_207806 [Xylariaceae sp. FL0016]|nr:hypothetical protein F5Y15DRAFT_207806 [Xylariaceae sp. FL0016]
MIRKRESSYYVPAGENTHIYLTRTATPGELLELLHAAAAAAAAIAATAYSLTALTLRFGCGNPFDPFAPTSRSHQAVLFPCSGLLQPGCPRGCCFNRSQGTEKRAELDWCSSLSLLRAPATTYVLRLGRLGEPVGWKKGSKQTGRKLKQLKKTGVDRQIAMRDRTRRKNNQSCPHLHPTRKHNGLVSPCFACRAGGLLGTYQCS